MTGPDRREPGGNAGLPVPRDATVERLARYAHLLDAAVRIPGTSIRLGLDSLLGLLPGGGDLAGAILSAGVVLAAARRGAPAPVLARMTWNVVVDAVLGAVPLLGDVVDVGWKANLRNVRLLEEHLQAPGRVEKRSRAALVGVGAALAVVVALLAVGAWAVASAVAGVLFPS
jgi:hypothetical protein